MKVEDFHKDPCLQMLAGMTVYEPDRQISERIRVRCHAGIARRRRVGAFLLPAVDLFCRRFLEPALIALGCIVYLSEVLRRALALYGF